MAQFLRISSRISRALRHAGRVQVLGELKARPRTQAWLEAYFGQRLHCRQAIEAGDREADAVLLVSQQVETLGVASLTDLVELARGRQVVCDLSVLAGLVGNEVLIWREQPIEAAMAVKNDAYFLDGFGSGDVLPWAGAGWAERGQAFGYRSVELGVRAALQSYDGRIVAAEVQAEGARIAAMDLAAMETETGLGDLVGLLVCQALGAEAVDLGQYQAPWRDYGAHVAEVEAWAKLHPDLVRIEALEPASVRGRRLRLVSVADDGRKPLALLSCCTHAHEWGPSYGVFAYLRYLVAGYERGDVWARTVLDNLAVAWVPVVSVDGFDDTWSRGVMVPYGPNWVDLNRNYPPREAWEAFDGGERGRPKGTSPLSEPETQVLAGLMQRFVSRGLVMTDYHEQACRGLCVHTQPDAWLEGVGAGLAETFNGRYLGQCLTGYQQAADLGWHNYTASQPLGAACTAANYAGTLGYPHFMVAEFMGNDDFSPHHVVARTDASASFTEHLLGGLLGRTAYNHRVEPRRAQVSLPELDPDEAMELVHLGANGVVLDRRGIRAGDGFAVELAQGQRLLALRERWKLADL